MSEKICRWGILGTAMIARKNWKSIWNAPNATLVAVASRDRDRCQQYIDECQGHVPFDPPPRAVDGYDALLAADDIDAVYIPLPTGLRQEWVVRAAEAGKHVLCEKPCAIDTPSLVEMLDACRRNNVQFMDGVMFMHSRRLDRLRQVLNDGASVGTIRRIASQFSFRASDEFIQANIRTSSQLEPHGCLGDLGWYNIRFSLWTMNYAMPRRVRGQMLTEAGRGDSPLPVPMEFSGELYFDGNVTASFYCSFITHHQQWANVSGSKGNVQLNDFVVPFYGNEVEFHVSNAALNQAGCEFNMEKHVHRIAVDEYGNGTPCAQETNLFRNFSALALSVKPDPSWCTIALKTQQVMAACLASARAGGQVVEID